MSENSEKDNKPQVTSKGVSGTKELKVRRVHKKKSELTKIMNAKLHAGCTIEISFRTSAVLGVIT